MSRTSGLIPPIIRRALAYLWAGPTTTAGLLLAGLARIGGGQARVVDGVIEAHGGLLEALLRRAPITGGAAAMTLGHVVIGRNARDLDRTRRHERVHVAQYERWGPFFVPAYFAACAVAWVRGHNAYFDSHFEREAYAADGVAVRTLPRRPPAIRWLRRGFAFAVATGLAAAIFVGLRAGATTLSPHAPVLAAVALGVGLVATLIVVEA